MQRLLIGIFRAGFIRADDEWLLELNLDERAFSRLLKREHLHVATAESSKLAEQR